MARPANNNSQVARISKLAATIGAALVAGVLGAKQAYEVMAANGDAESKTVSAASVSEELLRVKSQIIELYSADSAIRQGVDLMDNRQSLSKMAADNDIKRLMDKMDRIEDKLRTIDNEVTILRSQNHRR